MLLCIAEKYTAACYCWQERDLCCLHTGLSPGSHGSCVSVELRTRSMISPS
ncbi:unnamed protein product [Staurois parvus]|uniref:Uncharacterized protein n=1 Tax=Staurois parvus TaxID=386267 RepID=A0ABN9GNI9_9NEOB|nr:unnamed protein product [Staurois parvus]